MIKTFNVSFPDTLVRRIDRIAKRDGWTRSELLRNSARIYVEKFENLNELTKTSQKKSKKDYVKLLEGLGKNVWRALGGADKYLKNERKSWGSR